MLEALESGAQAPGAVLQGAWRLGGAEQEYRQALRCDPHNADVRYNMGVLLDGRGDLGGAGRAYNEALRSDLGCVFYREVGLLKVQALLGGGRLT